MLDEASIRKEFIERFKKKGRRIKKETLDALVKERIENLEFIEVNGDSVDDLPTPAMIKKWFRDEPDTTEITLEDGTVERRNIEFDYDKICLTDKLAQRIFESFYNWKWKQGEIIPEEIKRLILLNAIIKNDKDRRRIQLAKSRLANISLVGIVRFNKMERSPFFTTRELVGGLEVVRETLDFLENVSNKKFDDKIIKEEIYIFDVFR